MSMAGGATLQVPRQGAGDEPEGDANISQITTVDLSTGFVFEGFNESMDGVKVDETHDNFITAFNMLTGIRFAVSNINAKVPRPLSSADFEQTAVYSFNMEQGSKNALFQFKDYMPWVFRHLRELFGLDAVDYLMSLTAKYIVNELGSPGKSGSFFYYSRDYRFIIKTIHHSEHKLLQKILYDYYKHVKKYPATLISQFYGLHRVKLPLGRKIHFVVMNNVFPALYEIHYRYDLKGSTLGRSYQQKPCNATKGAAVYKDLDWIRSGKRIYLGPERASELKEQLRRDVAFLRRINVMDYSFLVGIHDRNKGNQAIELLRKHCLEFGPTGPVDITKSDTYGNLTSRERHEFSELQNILTSTNPTSLRNLDFSDDRRAPNNPFYHDHGGFQGSRADNELTDIIYYVGIIDFLTEYNFRKHTETFFKGLRHKRIELSAIPAHEYGERFLNFICTSIGVDPKDNSAPKKSLCNQSTRTTRTTYKKPQPLQAPLRPAQSMPFFKNKLSTPPPIPVAPAQSISARSYSRSQHHGKSRPQHQRGNSPATSPMLSSDRSDSLSTATSDVSEGDTKASTTTISGIGNGQTKAHS